MLVETAKERRPGKSSYVVAGALARSAGAARDDGVRIPQNDLQRSPAQLISMLESERHRIATDLHDGLGQSLTLILLKLDDMAGLLAARSLGEAEESLRQLKSNVRDAFGELRRVAMDLRPSIIDDLGILATLSWFFREFENACHNIKIERNLLVQEGNIPLPLKVTIFRILQEAVNNIVKHAKADNIRVRLTKRGDVLHLSIEDDGQGFESHGRGNNGTRYKGLGLVSMEERAKLSGGVFHVDSAVGKGTRILVSLPCEGLPGKL